MIYMLLQVAIGGAIGAVLRFATGLGLVRWAGEGFPVAILSVNVLGSFLMGAFVAWSLQKGFASWNLFVMTGILGGFTTFSAFSLEAFALIEKGALGSAAIYVLASVVLSIGGLALGVFLVRGLWA